MGASFRAEVLKTSRRPASWTLALALFGLLLAQYFLTYLLEGAGRLHLPENVLPNVLFVASAAGGPLALVFGSLAAGSEYGWGTLKTVLAQGPPGVAVLSGKVLALGACLAIIAVSLFALGCSSSFLVAGIEGEPENLRWPPAGRAAAGVAAGWLVLAAYCACGVLLAVLARGATAAVALGLVYALLAEKVLLGLPVRNGAYAAARDALPGKNAADLANSFGGAAGFVAPGVESVGAAQAALVLGLYVLVPLLLAAALFRRRDVA